MQKNTIFIVSIIIVFVVLYLFTFSSDETFDTNKNKYRIIFIKTKEYYLIYLKYPKPMYDKIYKIYKNKLNNIIL
jgi:hypothetical protein